jgi:outer membrane protein assembly factor BamD (BamD/ComL family)
LTNGDNNIKQTNLFVILILTFITWACHQHIAEDKSESEIELEIMQSASDYLDKGKYDQAHSIYEQFVNKYPSHPYVDDAAYRLAYISVIADDKNPYYDYKKAHMLFQNFIENYPNSRYINACHNWLNLLNTFMKMREEQSASKAGNGSKTNEINRLRNELKRIRAENSNLKKTLEDLQKAIER